MANMTTMTWIPSFLFFIFLPKMATIIKPIEKGAPDKRLYIFVTWIPSFLIFFTQDGEHDIDPIEEGAPDKRAYIFVCAVLSEVCN
jgi:hypothetical protein